MPAAAAAAAAAAATGGGTMGTGRPAIMAYICAVCCGVSIMGGGCGDVASMVGGGGVYIM